MIRKFIGTLVIIAVIVIIIVWISGNSTTSSLMVEASLNNIIFLQDPDIPDAQFDIAIRNITDQRFRGFAFVWAQNDYVTPPARHIWPVTAAQSCLSPRRQLWIDDHYREGWQIILNPGEEQIIEAGIFLPTASGARYFSEFRIVIYERDGTKVFDQTTKCNIN